MDASRFVKSAESRSLWNYTLSPGWTDAEVDILTKCMMKYGVGNWSLYKKLGVLPGKTTAQLNTQTQRLLGQQSTAAFTGLHIDPKAVFMDNALKQGEQYVRKSGVLINTGGRLTREEIEALRQQNMEKYGIKKEVYDAITIPTPNDDAALLAQIEDIQAHNYLVDAKIEVKRKELEAKMARVQRIRDLIVAKGGTLPTPPAPAEDGPAAKRTKTLDGNAAASS
ncbi:uncharacterized protein AMSG_04752 [Thecamonas trahens ATCC 50062]|uniref:Myb-like domain-containing protein n=1 Tax=Thecamonas trahens ATCC 50062 TaxID=461836 RepID=A0A0L0D9J4_THETB|nr:hypothetical protein AMSG_04752 [Thecamonas trahens ATCC 50062]KNC49009.1 hypothetical protein AMSG_04752 [Thecamonas trahens ATCC 50062]|eukprot:XP_013758420.1 hypothetical protein AMSG_04752 [Thecamonas trahens ATCC 50062]